MKNILTERRISLNQVAKLSGVNPSTAWRWALTGVRGVQLETYSLGAKRYSSEEALERFSIACTYAANGTVPPARTPRQRERDIAAAEAELDKMGV